MDPYVLKMSSQLKPEDVMGLSEYPAVDALAKRKLIGGGLTDYSKKRLQQMVRGQVMDNAGKADYANR